MDFSACGVADLLVDVANLVTSVSFTRGSSTAKFHRTARLTRWEVLSLCGLRGHSVPSGSHPGLEHLVKVNDLVVRIPDALAAMLPNAKCPWCRPEPHTNSSSGGRASDSRVCDARSAGVATVPAVWTTCKRHDECPKASSGIGFTTSITPIMCSASSASIAQ